MPGDEITVWFEVRGAAVEPLSQATKLRVSRKFYLLYDGEQPGLSYDRLQVVDPAAAVAVFLGESPDHGSSLGFQLTVPPTHSP